MVLPLGVSVKSSKFGTLQEYHRVSQISKVDCGYIGILTKLGIT